MLERLLDESHPRLGRATTARCEPLVTSLVALIRSADRHAVGDAAAAEATTPVETLQLLSPVTAPCRIVAQMTDYVAHVKDSGPDPATVPLTFFREASGSITGPDGEVIRAPHVRLLDCEVEIGLVIGRSLPVSTVVGADGADGADDAELLVTNDVSARDIQLPQARCYEAKSYLTPSPVGPRLTLLVNGEVRQGSSVADMIYGPAQALQARAGLHQLGPGDHVFTGSPGGTALQAPPKAVEMAGALLPAVLKWEILFRRQAGSPRHLSLGDVVEAGVRTPDGVLALGPQRLALRAAAA